MSTGLRDIKWVHCIGDIPAANDESLRRAILTIDDRGKKLKEAACNELRYRQQLEKIGDRLRK